MKKKKTRKRRMSGLGSLVVGTTTSSIIGSAMPGTTGTALNNISSGFSSFVAPAATITGAGMVMKQMRRFPKIKRRRRR